MGISETVGFLVSTAGEVSVFASSASVPELEVSETVGFSVSTAPEFGVFRSTGKVGELGGSETVEFLVSTAGESVFGSARKVIEASFIGFLSRFKAGVERDVIAS